MNQINQINMMNMNPLLPMNMMVPNNEIIKEGKKIKICIHLYDNENMIECYDNNKASLLKDKFNINDGVFICNYKLVDLNLSLRENGIRDFSNIELKLKPIIMNLYFKDGKGNITTLMLIDDCPLGVAVCVYLMKQGDPFILQSLFNGNIQFLYNSKKLKITDKTPINKIFNYDPTITVFEIPKFD